MADGRQTGIKRKLPRWVIAAVSTALIVALLAVYAFLTLPGVVKPNEVTITGTVAASGVNLEKITFTNTACGTRNVADILVSGENSGAYAISLDNGYSYNVSISWNDSGSLLHESDIGGLVLDTFDRSMVRDWTLQP